MDRHIEVHGRQSNVTTNAGSGFLANPRDGPIDRNGPGGEDARRGTSGVVLTEEEDPKVQNRGDSLRSHSKNKWLGCAVMPLMFALHAGIRNRASTWEIATVLFIEGFFVTAEREKSREFARGRAPDTERCTLG